MDDLSAGDTPPEEDAADGEFPADRANAVAGWRNELSGEVHGSAIQARSIYGDLYIGATPAGRMPVPSQLLPAPANFTDRSRELAMLQELADGQDAVRGTTLVVIAGVGGVGKTSLASYWLRQVRSHYGEGQLYADLGGHQTGGSTSPGEILGMFLRALGTPPEQVPVSLAEQAGLWRSSTDGRRLIVLLDDATTAAQVRTLLPGPGPSIVVVTTRRRLSGLAMDGAQFVTLGVLEETAAVDLLDKIAGAGRAKLEPVAAQAVVRLCGRLPLAVCVSAARLAPHPGWPIARMAGELAQERHRLAALTIRGDVSVRATFDVSYRALDPEAARLYRLAALIPGPGFGPGLAAAATAADSGLIGDLLEVLVESSLLEEIGPHRFRFHDLVRLHAREQAAAEPVGEQRAVVARSAAWYLWQSAAADLVVIPGRWRLGPVYDQARREGPAHTGPAAALAWLESELPGLVATVRAAHQQELHEQAWQLCEAMWGLFAYRKYFPLWIEVHTLGVSSAHACGDQRAEARMHVQLGLAYLELGQHSPARHEFAHALELDRHEGHRVGEATAIEQLGLVSLAQDLPDEAIRAFEEARVIFQQADRPRGAIMMTCHIGEAHRDAGRYSAAIGFLAEARRLSAAIPDPYNEARALTGLGQALTGAGQSAEAMAPLNEALAIMIGLGTRYEQARTRVALAEAANQHGDQDKAREQLSQALAIYDELGVPEAALVRSRLGALGADPADNSEMTRHNGTLPS